MAHKMDVGVVIAVAMLLVWGVVALGYSGPGWVNALLTAGVLLLIYRVVRRGTQLPGGRDRGKGTGD